MKLLDTIGSLEREVADSLQSIVPLVVGDDGCCFDWGIFATIASAVGTLAMAIIAYFTLRKNNKQMVVMQEQYQESKQQRINELELDRVRNDYKDLQVDGMELIKCDVSSKLDDIYYDLYYTEDYEDLLNKIRDLLADFSFKYTQLGDTLRRLNFSMELDCIKKLGSLYNEYHKILMEGISLVAFFRFCKAEQEMERTEWIKKNLKMVEMSPVEMRLNNGQVAKNVSFEQYCNICKYEYKTIKMYLSEYTQSISVAIHKLDGYLNKYLLQIYDMESDRQKEVMKRLGMDVQGDQV